jgi:hypothetical protein
MMGGDALSTVGGRAQKARYVSSTTKSYGLTELPRRFYDSAADLACAV